METLPAARAAAPLSDSELAQRVGHGDRQAFEALMRRHNSRLYRVARAILKDDADAEEALQESYLNVYQHITAFEDKSKLSTWLTRIVINESLQRLRKAKRDRLVIPFASLAPGQEDEIMATTAETKLETPEKATVRSEMRRVLEREIDGLPVSFRTVFILREVEELTVEETAECLDVPAATVRTRLFRAKSLLRESLERQIGTATEGVFGFAGERCDRIVDLVLARVSALSA